jgi:hypothetical protein
MTTALRSDGIQFADGTVWTSSDQVDRIVSSIAYNVGAVLTKKGKLVTWSGSASYSANALGTGYVRHMPMAATFPISETGTIVDAEIRHLNGWALFSSGNLYTWGYNATGMCGTGGTAQVDVPYLAATSVAEVYHNIGGSYNVGNEAIYIRKTDNTYWCTGYNGTGRLGLGDTTNRTSFTQITALTAGTVSKMWSLCGYRGTLFVQKTDNTIWACGHNASGSLGNGNTTQQNSLIDVTTAWGGASQVTQIIGSYSYGNGTAEVVGGFTCMLKANGEVYIAGINEGMGDGTATQKTTPVKIVNAASGAAELACISSGTASAIYIRYASGTLHGFGRNSEGQLATGDTTVRTSLFTMTSACTAILTKETGTNHYAWRGPFIWAEGSTIKGTGYNSYHDLCTSSPNLDTTTKTTATTLGNLHGLVSMTQCGYDDGRWYIGIIESNHTANGHTYKKRDLVSWGYNGRYNINPYTNSQNYPVPVTIPICC